MGVKLKHASGNGTVIGAPAANPSADITLKAPSTTGSAGQVLAVASANHSSTNAELEWVGEGKILQVVQTVNQAAHASGTNAIAQGAWFTPSITVAITPSSTSSKILFTGHVAASSGNSPKGLNLRVEKGGSALTGANAASVSSRTAAHSTGGTHNDDYAVTLAINYLDSPSTTSAVTYGFSIGHNNSSAQTLYINRTGSDTDNSSRGRYVTVLTAMEVAA